MRLTAPSCLWDHACCEVVGPAPPSPQRVLWAWGLCRQYPFLAKWPCAQDTLTEVILEVRGRRGPAPLQLLPVPASVTRQQPCALADHLFLGAGSPPLFSALQTSALCLPLRDSSKPGSTQAKRSARRCSGTPSLGSWGNSTSWLVPASQSLRPASMDPLSSRRSGCCSRGPSSKPPGSEKPTLFSWFPRCRVAIQFLLPSCPYDFWSSNILTSPYIKLSPYIKPSPYIKFSLLM